MTTTTISLAARVERYTVILNAIDWLRNNPEAQTRLCLARNSFDQKVSPTSPVACKWCVVGRIAHDLGIHHPLTESQATYNAVARWLQPLSLQTGDLAGANDRHDGDPLADLYMRIAKRRAIVVRNQLAVQGRPA